MTASTAELVNRRMFCGGRALLQLAAARLAVIAHTRRSSAIILGEGMDFLRFDFFVVSFFVGRAERHEVGALLSTTCQSAASIVVFIAAAVIHHAS